MRARGLEELRLTKIYLISITRLLQLASFSEYRKVVNHVLQMSIRRDFKFRKARHALQMRARGVFVNDMHNQLQRILSFAHNTNIMILSIVSERQITHCKYALEA